MLSLPVLNFQQIKKRNSIIMTSAHSFTHNTKARTSPAKLFVAPLLHRIKKDGETEYLEMQEVFQLMGWTHLPDTLKIEIYNDVKFMIQELKGFFCSCDPYVEARRNTVHFWVSSFQDGICSLEAAINGVKNKFPLN